MEHTSLSSIRTRLSIYGDGNETDNDSTNLRYRHGTGTGNMVSGLSGRGDVNNDNTCRIH